MWTHDAGRRAGARTRSWRLLVVAALLGALLPVPALAQTDAGSSAPPLCSGETTADYNGTCGPSLTLPRWTDAGGWDNPQYYATIQLADFNGDGRDELLARGASGIRMHTWDAAYGQWRDMGVQTFPDADAFSDSEGWSKPQHYSTITTVEYVYPNGHYAAALIAVGATGLVTYTWDGAQTWSAVSGGPDWVWDDPSNYLTVRTWENWLIGRGDDGVETWRFEGDSWTNLSGSGGGPFTDAEGWDEAQYYETIALRDLDDDATPELLSRAYAGMEVYAWSDGQWTLQATGGPFTYAGGWYDARYYETIRYADIDGKPGQEILGRGFYGMEAYSYDGSSFTSLGVATGTFDNAGGWDAPEYYETIQFLNLGSAGVHLIGRGPDGLHAYTYDTATAAFVEQFSGPQLADGVHGDLQWARDSYFLTIQGGDINGDGAQELIARGQFGLRTWAYNADEKSWARPLDYGFADAESTDLVGALLLLDSYLNIASGDWVRDAYTSLDSGVIANYQQCLNDSLASGQTQPPTQTCALLGNQTSLSDPYGVTADQWKAMVQIIQTEIAMAQAVNGYFNQSVSGVLNDLFAGNQNSLAQIGTSLGIDQRVEDAKQTGSWADLLVDMVAKLVSLAAEGLTVAAEAVADAVSGVTDLLAPSALSFNLEYSELQAKLDQWNSDVINQNNAYFQYVAQDYGLLYIFGELIDDQTWLITADQQDDLVSIGRSHYATWAYQTLLPSVWGMEQVICESGDDFPCPAADARNAYIVGKAGETIEGDPMYWARSVYWTIGSSDQVSNDDTALTKILDPIQDGCYLGPDLSGTWSYADCNLGLSKYDFYHLLDGWNFSCIDNDNGACANDAVAAGAAHQSAAGALGPSGPTTVNLGRAGTIHTAIYGSADFNAANIDPTTVTMAGASVIGWWVGNSDLTADGSVYWPAGMLKDLNGDGYLDAMLNFQQSQLQLTASDTMALIEGSLITGTTFMAVLPVQVIAPQ